MGGIDPSDPKASDEFYAPQVWEQVESLSDGLFRVCYRVTATCGHDFIFPVIGFPTTVRFVQTFARRTVNCVLRTGLCRSGRRGCNGRNEGRHRCARRIWRLSAEGELQEFPTPQGTFTILDTEAMRARANNTEDGPTSLVKGEVLTCGYAAHNPDSHRAL
jgi:hypothetical protein